MARTFIADVLTITRPLGARHRCCNGNVAERITAQFQNGNSGTSRDRLPFAPVVSPTHRQDGRRNPAGERCPRFGGLQSTKVPSWQPLSRSATSPLFTTTPARTRSRSFSCVMSRPARSSISPTMAGLRPAVSAPAKSTVTYTAPVGDHRRNDRHADRPRSRRRRRPDHRLSGRSGHSDHSASRRFC